MRAEARARAIAGVLALLLAALVAATFDGVGWPDRFPLPERTGSSEPAPETDGGEQPRVEPEPREPPSASEPSALPAWTRIVVRSLVILVLACALIALLVSVRFVILRRRLRGDAALRGDALPLPVADPQAEPEPVETALVHSLAGLDEGSPRNAVVGCWIRLEEMATSRGLPRQESDTPAEFVARALEAYRLDREALERLADLYREARFSEHPLAEEHRTQARACLERLVEEVRRGAVVT